MAARDLLHRAAQENHCIRRRDAGARRERELELARSELNLEGAQGKLQALEVVAQQLDHRFKLVVLVLGQELVASGEELDLRRVTRLPRVRGLQARIADAKDMEFDFQPGDELVARSRELVDRALEERARVE